MIPVIAIVGRPNVGKSTLFNRLTKSRDALVADYVGLTRDRRYGGGQWQNQAYVLIDTGGLTGYEMGIEVKMAEQSILAIIEATHVLFMVDAREGLTPTDIDIAALLRAKNKACHLVINKIDTINPDVAFSEFSSLGFAPVFGISATHGRGINSMLGALLPPQEEPEEATTIEIKKHRDEGPLEPGPSHKHGIKIAIVGRPNVGKSTLVNRMLGEDRVIVFDEAGTTRDSIYIPFQRNDDKYTLIDTAGVRRRGKVFEAIEKFSVVKTLQAIEDANVVIFVMNAQEGISEQDLHLLGFVMEEGRALVLAVNKWDGLTVDQKNDVKRELDRRLAFAHYAELHFISALHGTGVGHLYEAIGSAFKSAIARWPTPRLTRILEDAVQAHQPPLHNGRRIKLRYAHMGGANPPLIIIHGNQVDKLPKAYVRYLENVFRKTLELVGTPLRIEFKAHINPFEGKRNPLTERQVNKKRRLIAHRKNRDKGK